MIRSSYDSQISALERKLDYLDFELKQEIERINAEIHEIKESLALIDDLEVRLSKLERLLKEEVIR